MSDRAINVYCRQVKRLLLCPGHTKRALIRGLRAELRELPGEFTRSASALAYNYGDVSRTAEELQSAVSPESRVRTIKRRQVSRRAVWVAACILILTLVLAVLFLRYMPIYTA